MTKLPASERPLYQGSAVTLPAPTLSCAVHVTVGTFLPATVGLGLITCKQELLIPCKLDSADLLVASLAHETFKEARNGWKKKNSSLCRGVLGVPLPLCNHAATQEKANSFGMLFIFLVSAWPRLRQ